MSKLREEVDTSALTVEFIEDIEKGGLMYFLLGSLISADNCFDADEVKENFEYIKKLEELIPKTNFSEERKTELLDYIYKGKLVLSNDLKRFEEAEE